MPQDLFTALIGVCLVGALSYITNQLPALRQFRGSGVLLVLLAIELLLLAWVWQVASDGDQLYQAHRALFDGGKLVLWGASGVTLLLLVVGLLGDTPQTVSAPQLNLRDRLLQSELEEVEKRQDDSLHHQILIDLGMTDEREQVGRPSKQLITNETAVSLPAATQMSEVFRRKEVGGRLLILGDPGAGKTTMLLELAKSLLEAGQQDPNAPVPVILELSTWREDQSKTLTDWLVEQLWQKYKLSRETSREWLAAGQILPLLDGLDELGLDRQRKAMTAVNQYLQADAKLDLVVCCRWEEYQESQSQITQLNGAVRLQPLTDPQIQDYLWQLEQGNLWSHIRRDTKLLELARKPLFLHMMVVTYQEVQPFHSQADLFDAYILRRFELPTRKQVYSASKQEPSQQKTRHYLIWLAKQMQQQNKTEFLIERLQPTSLKGRSQLLLYRCIVSLLIGMPLGWVFVDSLPFAIIKGILLSGMLYGILHLKVRLALLIKERNSLKKKLYITEQEVESIEDKVCNLKDKYVRLQGNSEPKKTDSDLIILEKFSIKIEKLKSNIASQRRALNSARTFSLGRLEIQTVEPLFISSNLFSLSAFIKVILYGILINFGISSILLMGKTSYFLVRRLPINWNILFEEQPSLIEQIINGLATAACSYLLASIIFSLNTKNLSKNQFPNQGIRYSAINAIFFPLLGCSIYVIKFLFMSFWNKTFFDTLQQELDLFIIIGIFFGFLPALACAQHFAVRLLLWKDGAIPWNYAKFLAYAAELRLIQQVGGRYRFIHRLLRDHFAAM